MTIHELTNKQSSIHIHTSPGQDSRLLLIDTAPQVVYEEFLHWIKRCDDASKQGLPKPSFQTADGKAIFPEDIDEEWWKTDIARRIVQAHVPDEEEGPISAEEDHLSALDGNNAYTIKLTYPLPICHEHAPFQGMHPHSQRSYQTSVARSFALSYIILATRGHGSRARRGYRR